GPHELDEHMLYLSGRHQAAAETVARHHIVAPGCDAVRRPETKHGAHFAGLAPRPRPSILEKFSLPEQLQDALFHQPALQHGRIKKLERLRRQEFFPVATLLCSDCEGSSGLVQDLLAGKFRVISGHRLTSSSS